MDALIDAVNVLARQTDNVRPDLDIPDEYASYTIYDTSGSTTQQLLELRDASNKGKGWFARTHLKAGTLLMVAKPIVMAMDWQDEADDDDLQDDSEAMDDDDDDDDDDKRDDDDKEPRLNEILLIMLLELLAQHPHLWKDSLSMLFPRDNARLPAWICEDDKLFLQVEGLVQQLSQIPELATVSKDIAKRLPLIIRYNILSIETCSELLAYPGPEGYSNLSGVGLYYWPSFFNHSPKPNCSRYCIGDVLFIVTNQDIPANQECCISYIEHDILCESPYRRNLMLRMDFKDTEGAPASPAEKDGPELPVVDALVQNELMELDPLSRLSSIEELWQQAIGESLPEEEQEEEMGSETTWFQCDLQNLRIIKAITLDSMGQTKQALELWKDAVAFCIHTLPPNDEATVIVQVQAALCALHAGKASIAQSFASEALRMHHLLFGGGVSRFRHRLAPDLRLKLRSSQNQQAVDTLWPLV